MSQQTVQHRIHELNTIRKTLPEDIYQRRKKSIFTTLKRFAPGGSANIAAMRDKNGELHTDPAGMATCLREHWQQVFDAKATDGRLRRDWLLDASNLFFFEIVPTQFELTAKAH